MNPAERAIGISVHTGWAACVVAGGSLDRPAIDAREEIEILGDAERFVFHLAAEMTLSAAEQWIARARDKALANAKRALAKLITNELTACAIVARSGTAGDLAGVLASHPRLHTAEGYFYRDVLIDAMTVPVSVIAPSSLDPRSPRVGKAGAVVGRPWGRDQKLAALAAWKLLANTG